MREDDQRRFFSILPLPRISISLCVEIVSACGWIGPQFCVLRDYSGAGISTPLGRGPSHYPCSDGTTLRARKPPTVETLALYLHPDAFDIQNGLALRPNERLQLLLCVTLGFLISHSCRTWSRQRHVRCLYCVIFIARLCPVPLRNCFCLPITLLNYCSLHFSTCPR